MLWKNLVVMHMKNMSSWCPISSIISCARARQNWTLPVQGARVIKLKEIPIRFATEKVGGGIDGWHGLGFVENDERNFMQMCKYIWPCKNYVPKSVLDQRSDPLKKTTIRKDYSNSYCESLAKTRAIRTTRTWELDLGSSCAGITKILRVTLSMAK